MTQTHLSDSQFYILIASVLLILFSVYLFFRERFSTSILFLFIGGLSLRLMMAAIDPFLNFWDEQFHALVAKNMMLHPFKPTLYENPVLPYDYTRWDSNHIWLHKQPLFLWLIALSYKLFGINEFALRIPSAVMSALVILFIYRIGSNTCNKKVGWYGALLFTLSVFQLDIITGSIHTDHNDVAFMFFVTASVWSWTEYYRSGKLKWVFITGVLSGMAVLVKWLVGLLVIGIWGIASLVDKEKRNEKKNYIHLLYALLTAIFIFLPWQVYILTAFPQEAVYELKYNSKHFFEDVEGHKGDNWFHFDQLAIYYGKLAPYIILVAFFFFVRLLKDNFSKMVIAGSIVMAYLFYTFAKTKMPLFCNVVSPLVFLAFGALMYSSSEFIKTKLRPAAYNSVFFIAIILTGYWVLDIDRIEQKHTLRDPDNYVRQAAIYNKETNKSIKDILPSRDYVVFNCGGYNATLVMFYSDVTAYGFYPSPEQYEALKSKKINIAVVADDLLPGYLATDPDIFKIQKKIIPVH